MHFIVIDIESQATKIHWHIGTPIYFKTNQEKLHCGK